MQRNAIRVLRPVMRSAVGLALMFAAVACERKPQPPLASAPGGTASAEGTFEGSWNAAGTRRTIPLGGDRKGSTINLRGTMLLTGPGRPGAGFQAEVIGMVDTQTGLVGRAVWTDEHGDQVYSELKGEGTKEHNRVQGTFLGGTGRFSGITGTYEFAWEFVIESEDGTLQGRAVGLRGCYRTNSSKEESGLGGGGKP